MKRRGLRTCRGFKMIRVALVMKWMVSVDTKSLWSAPHRCHNICPADLFLFPLDTASSSSSTSHKSNTLNSLIHLSHFPISPLDPTQKLGRNPGFTCTSRYSNHCFANSSSKLDLSLQLQMPSKPRTRRFAAESLSPTGYCGPNLAKRLARGHRKGQVQWRVNPLSLRCRQRHENADADEQA
jgi:hypothetical protein